MHLSVVTFVSIVTAFVLSTTRILSASKWAWAYLPAVLQGILPGLVVALPAAAQGLTGAQSWTDVTVAFLVAGALVVPGIHSHTVAVKPPNGPGSSVAGAVALIIAFGLGALSLSACGLFASKFTWPDAVSCLPTPASLKTQVEAILLAGGDYVAALEQLALTDTKSAVLCAVDGYVSGLGPNDAAHAAARARGKAFLDGTGTKVSP